MACSNCSGNCGGCATATTRPSDLIKTALSMKTGDKVCAEYVTETEEGFESIQHQGVVTVNVDGSVYIMSTAGLFKRYIYSAYDGLPESLKVLTIVSRAIPEEPANGVAVRVGADVYVRQDSWAAACERGNLRWYCCGIVDPVHWLNIASKAVILVAQ